MLVKPNDITLSKENRMQDLEKVLGNYGVRGEVVGVNDGPLVKQIEFLPAPGTKVKSITSSLPDIAREFGVSSLRVESVEGTNNLGFEIPQDKPKIIDFNQILNSDISTTSKGDLPICLGVDIIGKPVLADLAKMPHLLVAGATGSGKSVGLNTFILSLIKAKQPKDLKLVLIDPKRIEFGVYNNQKYMLMPVVTDNKDASDVLLYLTQEMEKRYTLFEESLCKNIQEYNAKAGHIPFIVCVIDEFSDLVMSDKKVSEYILVLAQKARACGIHIILATQRPSVDVITGTIKANFPTRLSYKVASAVDSRTILDASGAENLIGRGDSLFLASNGELKRVHGAYINTDDIDKFLNPYRAEVKPVKVAQKQVEQIKATKPEEKKSIFRKGLEFWSSLRQREKKTIIAGAVWGIGQLLGGKKNKKK